MAKSKLDLMYKKEQEELKKKYGVKQTTPNVKILTGRNEEKMIALTGDKNFGSTVKDAFVKGVTAQADNQTLLAQNTAKNAGKVAQNYVTANAAYSDAYTRQAENVGNAAKKIANNWSNANAANSQAHLQMGQQLNEKKSKVRQEYGPIWGMTTGSTGSDQTGASIWGYRNDTRMEEPRSDWDVAARKEHRALKRTNPEDAGAFAIEVNEGLNRAERERKARALREWVSKSGANGAAAWVGGRGLNQISPLDSYNESLERAAIGVNREKSQLTATDIKEIIDDTNARNIEERFGKLGSLAYRGATWVADSKVSEKMFSQKLLDVGEKSITVDDVLSTIDMGVKAKKIVTGTKEWFEANKESLDSLTEAYKEKGMSKSKAWYKATREMLEDSYRKANGKK